MLSLHIATIVILAASLFQSLKKPTESKLAVVNQNVLSQRTSLLAVWLDIASLLCQLSYILILHSLCEIGL